MPWLIVVTGRPAAGKTTLANRLGRALSLPVFSKDRLKEVLFDQLGWQDREWSKKLGAASAELLYECAAIQLEAGRSLILENAFHPEWAIPKLLALKARYQADLLEIQCLCEAEVLFGRFRERAMSGTRHQGHVDLQTLEEFRLLLQENRPVALNLGGAVLQVDTNDFARVDYEAVATQVQAIVGEVG